ncbi:MAG TPA: hypothetical protein DHW02_01470 [Ktedonobacter sp.]|nr:hypothetical protein [Ktedonobacter sp.]
MCGLPRQQMTPISSPLPSSSQQLPPVVPFQLSTVPAMVAAPVMMQSASPYLPSGAPAWPTATTPMIPVNPSIASPATSGTLASAPYIPGGAKGEQRTRASLSARGILIALAFIILVPLAGAGITYGSLYLNGQVQAHLPQQSNAISQVPTAQPTANAGTTPTPAGTATTSTLPTPSKFDTMSSSSQKLLGALITYPDGWLEEPQAPQSDGSVVVDFRPQQQLGIVMFLGRLPASSGTASDVNTGQIQSLSNLNGVTNVQMMQPSNAQPTIGGTQWSEEAATFSDNNTTTFSVVSITVKHGTYFYNIFYWSPNQYYSDAVQKYMQPMIKSFKFLG